MTQFRVGDQPAVVQQGRADAGSEREHQYHPGPPGRRSETGLGQARRVGVIDHRHRPPAGLREQCSGIDPYPAAVQVGGRVDPVGDDDAGEGASDRTGHAGEGPDDLAEGSGHGLGQGGPGGGDTAPVGGERAVSHVDRGALDAAPTDVYAEVSIHSP